MVCEEKQKLLTAYSAAAIRHSDAVSALTTEVSLGDRETYELMSQGIAESDAHLTYLGAKSLLYSAARLGYGFSS